MDLGTEDHRFSLDQLIACIPLFEIVSDLKQHIAISRKSRRWVGWAASLESSVYLVVAGEVGPAMSRFALQDGRCEMLRQADLGTDGCSDWAPSRARGRSPAPRKIWLLPMHIVSATNQFLRCSSSLKRDTSQSRSAKRRLRRRRNPLVLKPNHRGVPRSLLGCVTP